MPRAPRSPVLVRPARPDDAPEIAAIYNPYVRTSPVTFEEAEVAASEMAGRIAEIQATALPWLCAVRDSRVLGYAYAARWKGRSAYRYSTETTVYVHPQHGGTGIGSALYRELLATLKTLGMHTAIGGITLPNEASIRLHESLGFRQVARFSEVGFKFDRWIDVGYWQRIL